MEDSLLTKCPHCQTLFRIQHEHLAAADGEVRCGVCYKVFDAQHEGLAYTLGEGSPAEKTFGNSTTDSEEETLEQAGNIIDTSPEPEPNPRQALAMADLGSSNTDTLPTADELNNLNIKRESVSETLKASTQASKASVFKWAFGSLIASLALVAQWLYLNADNNLNSTEWRQLYSTLCSTLNCELPAYQDISAIKTERLSVKSHAEYSGVLVIEMIINNTSEFNQALPFLEMTFFNLNGDPLAQRLFHPNEYLGQLTLEQMPSNTPIHLSFAILDPGNEAVNYSVNLAPAS